MSPETSPPPPVTVVTGPRGAGKTRWIQEQLLALTAAQPSARFALLLAEDGRTRMESFVRARPQVAVRRLLLPCFCCPGLVDLPGTTRALAAESNAAHVFLELPVLGAAGLIAEFDRALGWPRRLVLRRDPAWIAAEQAGQLAPPYALFVAAFAGQFEIIG